MIKPCPFCGSTKIEICFCEPECCGGQPRWVECECGCSLSVCCQTAEEAWKMWNSRVEDNNAR